MNILVTGAKGMVGTALCNNLKIFVITKTEPDQIFILRKFMSMI